ncbi:unnamed protein product [marine sediment metagenome]|uniref:Uncharacterized protein n=1 Tax=marine sediment metagenome TaxID=412755 RepID=X1SUN9_9ZZZZ
MKGIKRGMQKQSLELLAKVQKIIDSYDFAIYPCVGSFNRIHKFIKVRPGA